MSYTPITFEDRLLDLLSRINALGSPENRNALVRNLPRNLVQTMPRYDTPQADLISIIENAKQWGFIYTMRKQALEIVIDNTRRFVQGSQMEQELIGLKSDFQQSKQIDIRIAVTTMTREQAIALDNETVFNNQEELNQFKALRSALHKCGITDFTLHYGEYRDDWKPCVMVNQRSIREILQGVGQWLKANRDILAETALNLIFLSDQIFSVDEEGKEERLQAEKILKKYGGILIIDIISLYHPQIRNTLMHSQLIDSDKPVAMIVVSPLESKVLELNELLTNHIYISPFMERAFDSFAKDLNPLYQFDVNDIYNLRRWLSSTFLANLGYRQPRISRDAEIEMQGFARQQLQSSGGIENIILGRAR